MRASLNEIMETEHFLLNQLSVGDALVFEAKLLTNPTLRVNSFIQQKIHLAVKAFSRRQLKQQLRVVHKDLFSRPDKIDFQQKVLYYFNR